ncbi:MULTISPECIES: FimB/Mfa2 family fimbrial subunit [unclassified Bacteroides]|uniref:FimB/Mfa2 family fimbrial subunit n=2 Tax=Bacteroides TaxID=816 RepID=UPI002165C521|nr:MULTISPECIES: FimB/Mfa2 family fimbrial subunit [unclassified Bacteroides]MCS2337098.1 FimB/Mfa2 family fimbrial subunit [Bacteroides sp. BFG-606]
MNTLVYMKEINKTTTLPVLMLLSVLFVMTACDGIYEDEGDCSVHYHVKFRYDMNMKFADAFAHEVNSVTLYVLDEQNNVVWQGSEQGEALAQEGYAMEVDVAPGSYSLLAWCGLAGGNSFVVPVSSCKEDLICSLKREHKLDGTAYVKEDLNRLYHGYLEKQTFSSEEGTHTFVVPLVKNTNNIRVVLQHLSGEPVDKDKFTFSITDENGVMNWDNKLLSDEPVTYYAWHTDSGTAGIDDVDSRTVSSFSAAIAELTTARLVKEKAPRLKVTNDKGETVFSIPLIDYALLVKGEYNRRMDDQEYLDRQDEYNMVFFLDEGDRWMDAYIYINSWKVVLQETGI